jgi:hypothetical protein
MQKSNLIECLNRGPVVVTFTKKDGSERIMPCTTNDDIIAAKGKSTDYLYQSADTLTVFDLEKNDWRSFNISSVKKVQVI